jgi:sulfoxide reductase heme-binding subunit YedZ
MTSTQTIRWVLKPIAFLAGLGPALWLAWAAVTGNLSANPLSDLTNETGVWALRFLCVTLAITPLRRFAGLTDAIRFRRMAGLFAFFYGSLHFLVYVIADRFAGLDFVDGIVAWSTVTALAKSVAADVYKRPFITIGFLALVSMVPLAITSTAGMIRRMGGRRWQALHRVVYLTAVLGVVHYWWLVKLDISRPMAYAVVVGLLLLARIRWSSARVPVTARTGTAPSRFGLR